MKIALLAFEFPPDTIGGGIGTYMGQAARCLGNAGHLVEVFAASSKREGRFAEGRAWVNLIKTDSIHDFGDLILPVFCERHSAVGFDVVESPDYFADGRAIRAAFPDLPHVVKMHTPLELLHELAVCRGTLSGACRYHWRQLCAAFQKVVRCKRPSPWRGFRPDIPVRSHWDDIEREHTRTADLVVSPSISLRDWVVERWGIPPERTAVVPYPYEPNEDLLASQPRAGGKTVGFFGRLEHRKGMEVLAEMVPMVLRAVPDAKFRLVGGSSEHPGRLEPYEKYLKRRWADFSQSIEFVGRVSLERIPEEFSKVGVCVIPSLWENFPNVCLEAMAAGRAVVGSLRGGMADMIESGESGILGSPDSPEDFAEALIYLLENPAVRESMGLRAREMVLKKYNFLSIAELMCDAYRKAALRVKEAI
jgi:glycosyltransferase involved in cell wall biosynthesis